MALLADVLKGAVHADHLAGVVEHRFAQGAHPECLPAGVENLELLVVGDTFVDAGGEQRLDLRLVLLPVKAQTFVQR